MKKLFVSLFTLAVVGALAFGATRAYFSDTETSTGNTFQAGGLDLKVDSECHYYQNGVNLGCGTGPGSGNWEESDLETGVHKFFNFSDIKPGDYGEDTVSLHVVGNDAWGRIIIDSIQDLENDCLEPELPGDTSCTTANGDGELRENLKFFVWLDQGDTPGFNGKEYDGHGDAGEGDNVWNNNEPILIPEISIDASGGTYNIWEVLRNYRQQIDTICIQYPENDPDGDGKTYNGASGCQGLALDGRLVGSTTYYFGIGWRLPGTVGNEVQSDSLVADVTFEVEQHRNNSTPFAP